VHTDTSYQRLLRTLGNLAPATAETVAAALGLGGVEVTAALSRLARVGYVRQWRDGRWRRRAQNLRLPKIDQIDNADRPRVAAYLNAKYDLELRLLTWAARHRDEFGPWGKGERAVTHLTETELSSLDAEYNELITRYCLLRTGPTRDTREVAVRFYAFPFHPVDEASEESRATPYPEPAG